jgi:hypothetical protein
MRPSYTARCSGDLPEGHNDVASRKMARKILVQAIKWAKREAHGIDGRPGGSGKEQTETTVGRSRLVGNASTNVIESRSKHGRLAPYRRLWMVRHGSHTVNCLSSCCIARAISVTNQHEVTVETTPCYLDFPCSIQSRKTGRKRRRRRCQTRCDTYSQAFCVLKWASTGALCTRQDVA